MERPFACSPTDKAFIRKGQHKFTTPPWKEVYKKRCLDQLRKSKQSFLERFRCAGGVGKPDQSMVADVMSEEWMELRKDHADLPTCSELLLISDDEEITYVNSIMEEIQRSLRTEEEHLLEMYCQDYEANLCESLDQLSADSVMCPICQRYRLMMNKGVIMCPCGMRINTEQDALTLVHVKEAIESGVEEHNKNCEETAVFSTIDTYSIDNLLISCEACDFMYIVV